MTQTVSASTNHGIPGSLQGDKPSREAPVAGAPPEEALENRLAIIRRAAEKTRHDRRPICIIDVDDVPVRELLRLGIAPERIHLRVIEEAAGRRLYPTWERSSIRIDSGPIDQIPTAFRQRYGDGVRLGLLWIATGGTFETVTSVLPGYIPFLAPLGDQRSHVAVTVADQRGNKALNNMEALRRLGRQLFGAGTFDEVLNLLRDRHGHPYPWTTEKMDATDQAFKELSFLLHWIILLAGPDLVPEILAELDALFEPGATIGPRSTEVLREAQLRTGLHPTERITYLGLNSFRMATFFMNIVGRGGHSVPLSEALLAACRGLAHARCGGVSDGGFTVLQEKQRDVDDAPSSPRPDLSAIAPEPAPANDEAHEARPADATEAPRPPTPDIDQTPVSPPVAAFDPTPACPPIAAQTTPPRASADDGELRTIEQKLRPTFTALAALSPELVPLLERLVGLARVGIDAEAAIARLEERARIDGAAHELAKRTHAAVVELKNRRIAELEAQAAQSQTDLATAKADTRVWTDRCRGHESRAKAISEILAQAPTAPEPEFPTTSVETQAPAPVPGPKTKTPAPIAETPPAEAVPAVSPPPAAPTPAPKPEACPAAPGPSNDKPAENRNDALLRAARDAAPKIQAFLQASAPDKPHRFKDVPRSITDDAVLQLLCANAITGWLGNEITPDLKGTHAVDLERVFNAFYIDAGNARQSFIGVVRGVTSVLQGRDPFRRRVLEVHAEIAEELAKLLNWAQRSTQEIRTAQG
jgi:hypothetical protein